MQYLKPTALKICLATCLATPLFAGPFDGLYRPDQP